MELIDKGAVINHLAVLRREDEDLYDIYETMKRIIRNTPTVEAVSAKEADALERRLTHLLESDYIRQYDEKIPQSGEYKLDIRDADKPMHKWIPCSERMPQEGKAVLVYISDCGVVVIASLCADCWIKKFSDDEILYDSVTHWMPLPKPPSNTPTD